MPEDDHLPHPDLPGLVGAARAGDERAWRTLHDRLTPRMRVEARRYRLCASDVDEVVQFAWARCVEDLATLRVDAALPGWLLATCRRRALRLLHEQRRCAPTDLTPERPEDQSVPGPAEVALDRERLGLLRDAVLDLPDRQRDVLVALVAAERAGHGYAEVAAELDLPQGSIGPTRRRAVRTLRRALVS